MYKRHRADKGFIEFRVHKILSTHLREKCSESPTFFIQTIGGKPTDDLLINSIRQFIYENYQITLDLPLFSLSI